ncbi:cd7 antigen-like [Notolabrus celidotus]|uniref:cd7 antigen-like n=1 Tax=Notolabrus celidotus TaxID=1203425 RepID=UPI00149082FA|nr:cd7 antigen-like [Notolabrus celidotus]
MTGIRYLASLWTLFFMQTGWVGCEIQFLERNEGGSVVLPCVLNQRDPPPYGVYLMRKWLHPGEMLFMYTKTMPTVGDDDKNRTSVSGDPSSHSLNVTISQLRASDTDRYFCEFVVDNPVSEDLRLQGNTEFFLLVTSDAPGSMDIGSVETCAGGSAVLPCLPPQGEALAVEGVCLKRQRNRWAPVELLYHSKRHSSNMPSSSSSRFPDERFQLSLAPSPGGITYNLTLLQLQPEDSGLYSCTLLLRGSPDRSTDLGRNVFFVSVQGQCGCSGYSSLLYTLSAAVTILVLFLFIGCLLFHKGKARRNVKARPHAPIYEEMSGVKTESRKLAPCHLEEMDSSEYKNCHVKKSCPENHYERPSGSLYPRSGSP